MRSPSSRWRAGRARCGSRSSRWSTSRSAPSTARSPTRPRLRDHRRRGFTAGSGRCRSGCRGSAPTAWSTRPSRSTSDRSGSRSSGSTPRPAEVTGRARRPDGRGLRRRGRAAPSRPVRRPARPAEPRRGRRPRRPLGRRPVRAVVAGPDRRPPRRRAEPPADAISTRAPRTSRSRWRGVRRRAHARGRGAPEAGVRLLRQGRGVARRAQRPELITLRPERAPRRAPRARDAPPPARRRAPRRTPAAPSPPGRPAARA